MASASTSAGSPGRVMVIVTPVATEAGSSARTASLNQMRCRPSRESTTS